MHEVSAATGPERTTPGQLTGLAYDEHARPTRTAFIGSIKWRGRTPFDRTDTNALAAVLRRVPGTDENTLLTGVSSAGFRNSRLDIEVEPDELLDAWGSRERAADRGSSIVGLSAAPSQNDASNREPDTPGLKWVP